LGFAFSLLAAFVFAGAETAITCMSEMRIRRLLENGTGPRGFLQVWLDDPAKVLTTLLTGNTLALTAASSLATSITLSTLAQYKLDPSVTDWALTGVVLLVAVLLLIVSEIAPKTLGKIHPDWFLTPMRLVWWFHLASRWLTGFTTWVALKIVYALGGKGLQGGFQVTEQQIEDMVRIGSEAGSIDENRGDMLQGVFDLSDRPVRAIMTPRTQIDGLRLGADFDLVMQQVLASHFSRYPVYDTTLDKIVGIFYAKDLLAFCGDPASRGSFVLSEHVKDVRFVPESKKAIELLREFQTHTVHMAVVVDEHGGTSGIVTLEDVLEEVVGEIYDEYDQPEPAVVKLGGLKWRIDAGADAKSVATELNFPLGQDSSVYNTIGGFVVDRFGRVPQTGESLAWEGWKLKVLQADETRLVKLELEQPPAPELQDRPPTPAMGARRVPTGMFRNTGDIGKPASAVTPAALPAASRATPQEPATE
jgi:CBS domain containing-hemolysin-like protein